MAVWVQRVGPLQHSMTKGADHFRYRPDETVSRILLPCLPRIEGGAVGKPGGYLQLLSHGARARNCGHNALRMIESAASKVEAVTMVCIGVAPSPLGIQKFRTFNIRDRQQWCQSPDQPCLEPDAHNWRNRAPEGKIRYTAISRRNVKSGIQCRDSFVPRIGE